MAGKANDNLESIDLGSSGIKTRMAGAAALGLFLFIGIGGWAAQAKLAGAVVSHGEVAVSGEIKQVQHVDGGTVVDIPVKTGDLVRKGDVVLKLDETQLKVELDILHSQIAQLGAMRARLIAERDGDADVTFSETGAGADLVQGELKLFTENRRMRENQKQQLRMQSAQLRNQIDGLQQQLKAGISEEELLSAEITHQSKLLKNGLVRANELRELKRQLVRLQGTIGDVTASIAQAEGQISELDIKLTSIDQTSRSEAQKEIVSIDARLAELQQRVIAVDHKLTRTTVRAPEAGYIYDLQAHTVGGVVSPGQSIMSLVPEGRELRVDVKVAPVDIDRVASQQPARLRFTAFNRQTTPEIRGHVDIVAAATSVDKASNMPYYKTTIVFLPADLGELGAKLHPGMPVEVYIETDERTVVSYLAKPLTDQIMRAFREE